MRYLMAILLSFSLCSAHAQELDKSRANPIGTETHPLVVQTGISPKVEAQVKLERETKERNDREMIQWTAYLTKATAGLVIVAFFQLWFFAIQLKMMREGAKDTADLARAAKDNAAAANESAKAITAAERAYIFLDLGIQGNIASSPSGWPNRIKVKLLNLGKTPAEIVQIRAYADVQISNQVPQELPALPGSDITLPPGLGIAKDGEYEFEIIAKIDDAQLGEIERSNKTLFCIGCIRYRDIFNVEHETGFCWFYLYHMALGYFQIDPDSQLNRRT